MISQPSRGERTMAASKLAADGQVPAPSIQLPKGGGAIKGIGEKFAANPVTGTGSMSVPIATSPGRAGFGPQLSLAYDSGSGNGPFGNGRVAGDLVIGAHTRAAGGSLWSIDDRLFAHQAAR